MFTPSSTKVAQLSRNSDSCIVLRATTPFLARLERGSSEMLRCASEYGEMLGFSRIAERERLGHFVGATRVFWRV